jgi:hypothetical protein
MAVGIALFVLGVVALAASRKTTAVRAAATLDRCFMGADLIGGIFLGKGRRAARNVSADAHPTPSHRRQFRRDERWN